jgi:Tol biopolymer transport system component
MLSLFACTSVRGDYMVYSITDYGEQPRLMLYDPGAGTHTALLLKWRVENFSISAKNRLAFLSSDDGKSDIYLLDYPFVGKTPVKITSTTSEKYIFGWSKDGRYLAYESAQPDGKTLLLWDGKASAPIYQYQNYIGELEWSADGRLAFTDFYTFDSNPGQDPSEVLVWDGTALSSVSQNPSGGDRFPAWSAAGQLAFLSEQRGGYDILVWDGVSQLSGLPDTHTYANIAPDWTFYYSNPVWTDSGLLTFIATGPGDQHAQIYLWNGHAAVNISQNPGLHNGGQHWSADGHWAFITFFSKEQLLYVRDPANQTLLTTPGQYSPAWSDSGLLMFCVPSSPGWSLAIWNGSTVIEIAHGYLIEAFWRNGSGVLCSSG